MRAERFSPTEILFSPTSKCNLICAHCDIKASKNILSKNKAVKFLLDCKKHGLASIGFTGGEPFLAMDFLRAITQRSVERGITFTRIMTNGVWFTDKASLRKGLLSLRKAGYDGSICVSVDAFHSKNMKKVAAFIKETASIWERPDIISIAYVGGARETETKRLLKALSHILKAHLYRFPKSHAYIRNDRLFIRIFRIVLSPVGRAEALKDPWDGRWFKEDHCEGPGNVFYVAPSGDVKPCCGYANDDRALTIGNIHKDSVKAILKKAKENRYVRTIFGSGLSAIRNRLEASGIHFPGKTRNHCYFCHYILKYIPRKRLERCLD